MADLHWTKVSVFIVILTLSVGMAFAVTVDDQTQPVNVPKVTVHLSNTPVIDAIDAVFKNTGYKYTIEPGVSGYISIGLKDVSFEQAIKSIAEGAHLQYEVKGGRYIFRPIPPQPTIPIDQPGEPVQPVPDNGQIIIEAPAGLGGGPIFYGSMYPGYAPTLPPPGYYYPLPGQSLIPPSTYGEVPMPLPPPQLRSPSMQRFLNQMTATHSMPGFPFYRIGYGYPPY
jgi:hypothetical protein